MEDNEILAWVKLWTFFNIHYTIDESDYARFYKGRDVDFHYYQDFSEYSRELKRKLIDDRLDIERRWREEQIENARFLRDASMPRKMTKDDL